MSPPAWHPGCATQRPDAPHEGHRRTRWIGGCRRELARGIHPAVLAKGGLRFALKTLARCCPIPVDLQVHAKARLPEPVEVSAYYVVAEALTNAARHAHASAAGVEAEIVGDHLRAELPLTATNDGVTSR